MVWIGSFRYINIQLGNEAERTQTKEQASLLFIHLFCLCPLSLAIKLNFNISKGPYCMNSVQFLLKMSQEMIMKHWPMNMKKSRHFIYTYTL